MRERAADCEWKTLKLDPAKTIASVGFKIYSIPGDDRYVIHGMKIYSDDYEELVNVTWDKDSR